MLPGTTSQRRTPTIICVAFTLGILLLYFTNGQYDRLDEWGRDWLLTNRLARRADRDDRIVFLAIDEATRQLDTLFDDELQKSPALRLMKQPFPWNRAIYGKIIERLANAGAKAIVFDLVFPSEREGDEEFRAALEKYRDRVVIGSNLVSKGQEDVDGSVFTATSKYVPPSTSLIPAGKNDPRVGFVNVHVDEDEIVRRVNYRTTLAEFFRDATGGEELYSLAARALQQAGLADHIPPGHRARVFRYAEDFQSRSVYEIFVDSQWNAPPYLGGAFFRDKIVVIGSLGHSSEDRLQTPFGVTQGPYIHLNAINAALHDDFIHRGSALTDVALILVAGALAWVLGAYIRRPFLRLVLLFLIAGAFVQTAQWMANSGLLTVLISPLLVFGSSGLVWSAWEQVLDRIEKQRTRKALDRYVGKDVAREILDPTSFINALHGERRKITVIFSDIRGFTTRTETANPHALVKQLNEYFEAMVAIIYANRGTPDKFIGDAVMAHWGSIVSKGPAIDTERAVNAVLEMQATTARMNVEWARQGVEPFQVGYGVNHGDAIVGNLGCEAKSEISTIGDAINLGSRLEGATKQYHIDICIGESAATLVRDKFILRSVDLIVVKGKTRPVAIFTVLGRQGASVPTWLSQHEEAVRLYRAGDFAAAEKAWREVLAQAPGDGLAKTFIARCEELQAHPPEAPWTGVYEMKSK